MWTRAGSHLVLWKQKTTDTEPSPESTRLHQTGGTRGTRTRTFPSETSPHTQRLIMSAHCASIKDKHTLTCRLVALVQPLLVKVQGEQEVRVPPGLLLVRRPAAPPRCQGGVQEKRCSLRARRSQLRLVLQLMEKERERDVGEAERTCEKPKIMMQVVLRLFDDRR